MELIEKSTFNKFEFRISAQALLLVQGPSVSNARNIRLTLEDALRDKYGIELCLLLENFTMDTDGAAVMARVASASISPDLHVPNEIWMRCMPHLLNNAVKKAMASCSQSDILLVVAHDFHAMKKITEDANRGEWNHHLPEGFRFKQECKTRFGTHYYCAERFLKSASRLNCLIERKAVNTAKTAYGPVKKT